MNKGQKLALTIIVLAAAGLVVTMFKSVRPVKDQQDITVTRQGIPIASLQKKASDPVRGNSRPTVTIFEFSDFGCEHCAAAAPVLKEIINDNPDVQLVWKDVAASAFPSPSIQAHIAARCAQRQGSFWEYHDALFANQEILGEATYFDIAAQLGLNESTFETCYREQAVKPLIDEGSVLANALDIEGTPYFVIGSDRFSGARSKAYIQSSIDKARN